MLGVIPYPTRFVVFRGISEACIGMVVGIIFFFGKLQSNGCDGCHSHGGIHILGECVYISVKKMKTGFRKVQKWGSGRYNLRRFREELGITKRDMADVLSVSLKTYTNWEKHGIGLAAMVEVIEVLGGEFVFPVHPFDLFELEGELYRMGRFMGKPSQVKFQGIASNRDRWTSAGVLEK